MSLGALLIPAQKLADGRASARRRVLFSSRIVGVPGAVDVLLRNISATGLLLECASDLALGEAIDIDLPHAGNCQAIVVWRNAQLYGCRFQTPLSSAAISAALLRSDPERTERSDEAAFAGPSEFDRALELNADGSLSFRARVWIIFALAILSWALVAIVAWGVVLLLG